MTFARFFSLLVVIAVCAGSPVHAQDFQPPRPPPLDPATDFEDMEEDMIEMGDEGYRPPGVPPGPGGSMGPGVGAPPPPPPSYDTASGSAFGSGGGVGGKSSKNNPFQIVPGEFYEPKLKKKRSRGVMRRIDAPAGGKS